MHTRMLVSKRFTTGETVRYFSFVGLTAAVAVVVGCQDAPTSPLTSNNPMLAVSTDGAWLVNSLADPGDGVCSNSECTLREAIAAAQNGDRITFKSNLIGTIGLTAGELVVEKTLTFEGPGADRLAVSGQNASTVFKIGNHVDSIGVVITGLTITDGMSFQNGGGVWVTEAARVVLVGSVVTRNRTGDNGGGISSDGTLTVAGSTIADNEAGAGGGIYTPDGRLTVIRTTISGNTSSEPDGGGGIFAGCQTAWCGASTIRSSVITRNEASNLGGGLALLSNPISISSTIIAGNESNLDTEADCSGTAVSPVTSLGYNLSRSNSGCELAAPTDVNLTLASQVFTVVLLPVLATNGGRVPTHALIERGLAVDAGYCPGEGADVRGFPRPYDDLRVPNALDGCDIGPFEWSPADTKGKGPKP
jgi:CSLREA domain-containing protein